MTTRHPHYVDLSFGVPGLLTCWWTSYLLGDDRDRHLLYPWAQAERCAGPTPQATPTQPPAGDCRYDRPAGSLAEYLGRVAVELPLLSVADGAEVIAMTSTSAGRAGRSLVATCCTTLTLKTLVEVPAVERSCDGPARCRKGDPPALPEVAYFSERAAVVAAVGIHPPAAVELAVAGSRADLDVLAAWSRPASASLRSAPPPPGHREVSRLMSRPCRPGPSLDR